MKAKVKAILTLVLLLNFLPLLAHRKIAVQLAKTEPAIVVPDDYSSIQAAINAANPGDTIYVRVGIYYENIVVNKTVMLIGENQESIIDGDGRGTVIHITANNITITGFTIQNSGIENKPVNVDSSAGIKLDLSDYNTISKNNILNNEKGIALHLSNYNTFMENNITNNNHAIAHWCSDYNALVDNNIVNNSGYGIYLGNTRYTKLVTNTVTDNSHGIYLGCSSYNLLNNNSMVGNEYNFGVWGWLLSHYTNDVDASNRVDGRPVYYWVGRKDQTVPSDAGYVALISSTNVTVKNLHLKNNAAGILLANTTDSLITNNNVTSNDIGIWLYASSNNSFYYNNFINNTWQVYEWAQPSVEPSINVWDHGYLSGGNYWSDYVGVDEFRGPNQDQPGRDGIGDVPYVIDENNVDRYPLMNPWPSIHDIAITSLTASNNFPRINETVYIYVTAQNKGHFNETLTIAVNYTRLGEQQIGNQTIRLSAGKSKTLSFTWTPTTSGIYEIKAYTSPTPEDINPEDNTKTTHVIVTIYGMGIGSESGWLLCAPKC